MKIEEPSRNGERERERLGIEGLRLGLNEMRISGSGELRNGGRIGPEEGPLAVLFHKPNHK